jgi:hypothetical protein
MNSADSFSADYNQARNKFREQVALSGGKLERIAHPVCGPDGGDLSTDVGWFGPKDADKVLVTISATHGVEGFCGSGAQIDWLRRGEATRLKKGTGVLIIHALNPYGFAWLRRVTHENVDLNRNWIDFTAPLPENTRYDQLSEAICPADWTEESLKASAAVFGVFLRQNGLLALQQVISGGQYRHASGLFYGGTAETWSRRTQTAIFETYLRQAGKVAIIDYHSGLGPWGFGEQIVTQPRGSREFQRARRWFGGAVVSLADGSSTSTDLTGDGLGAAPKLLPDAEVTGMTLEIGTLPLAEVFMALRAEAWLHAHGDPASEQGQAIKAQIRTAFYGDADDWKGMVAGQSLLACRQALAGLQR